MDAKISRSVTIHIALDKAAGVSQLTDDIGDIGDQDEGLVANFGRIGVVCIATLVLPQA